MVSYLIELTAYKKLENGKYEIHFNEKIDSMSNYILVRKRKV